MLMNPDKPVLYQIRIMKVAGAIMRVSHMNSCFLEQRLATIFLIMRSHKNVAIHNVATHIFYFLPTFL